MTGIITLMDGGQNYIRFVIACDIIESVSPSGLAGWRGTKILNTKYEVGGKLTIDLQWRDFNPILDQTIVSIVEEELPGSEWLLANKSKEKYLFVNHVTGLDHMAYMVECEGLPFVFDCVNLSAIAGADAFLRTDKIPAWLLIQIDGAQLVNEGNPGSPMTIALIWDRYMTIFNNYAIDYGIVAHEATHPWAKDKWGQTDPPDDTDFMAARRSGEPSVTLYGDTDPGEDIAECFRYYLWKPTYFKEKCPLRYPVVARLFEEPEDYYG